jgi:hypothetical protein
MLPPTSVEPEEPATPSKNRKKITKLMSGARAIGRKNTQNRNEVAEYILYRPNSSLNGANTSGANPKPESRNRKHPRLPNKLREQNNRDLPRGYADRPIVDKKELQFRSLIMEAVEIA